MRPIKLVLGGLQSFEKKQTVDFDYLGKYGLFGIFGPTGSGKSTILDAITLALYGDIVRIKTSGRQANINDLLNINSKEIYVSFEFSIGRDIYYIERIFKAKKDERIIGTRKVLMTKNEDVIADKITDIAEEIIKIIGLGMEDFTRSVILPQGKFSEFLKLSGVERRAMLERLFNLEEYGRAFLNKIKNKRNRHLNEMNAIDNQIKGKGIVDIDFIKKIDEDLFLFGKELIKSEKEYSVLDKKIKEDEEVISLERDFVFCSEKLAGLDKKKEDIQKLLESLKESIDAEAVYKKYMDFEEDRKILTEKEDLKKKLELEFEEIKVEHKKAEKEILLLEEERKTWKLKFEESKISRAESEKVSELKGELSNIRKKEFYKKELEEEKIKLENEVKNLVEKLCEKEKELACVEEENSKLKEVEDREIFDLEKSLYELNIKEIRVLEDELENIDKKKVEDEKRLFDLENKIAVAEERQNKYRENIAIELAVSLVDGEPCMVCGSKEHPNIAKGSKNKGDFESLYGELIELKTKAASINISQLEKERTKILEKLNGQNSKELEKKEFEISLKISKLRELQKNIKKQKEACLKLIEEKKKEFEKYTLDKNILEEKQNNNHKNMSLNMKEMDNIKNRLMEIDTLYLTGNVINYSIIEAYIKEIDEKYEENDKINKHLVLLEKKLEEKSGCFEKIGSKVAKEGDRLKSIEGELIHLKRMKERSLIEFEEILAKSDFENIEAVKIVILTDAQKNNINETVAQYEKEVLEAKSSIKHIESKLAGRKADLEKYDENKENFGNIKIRIEELKGDISKMLSEKERLEKLRSEIEDLLLVRKKEEKEYLKYDDLSSLFEGNKFVEFLAVGKIRSIAKNAGRRLENISNGRYGLSTDKNGNFLIIDNFNGGELRKSSTLSGGESFLVSLSLALALSSQIQLKGQSQLEFFFLDEGFGTLDASLLDKVMTSLEKLRNQEGMKVGIISHVEELKERVPRKIEVEAPVSGGGGSSLKII